LIKFDDWSGDRDVESITSEDILSFLTENTEGLKQSTKRFKYTLLKTFFNFVKNTSHHSLTNPCDSSVLKKTFKLCKGVSNVVEAEVWGVITANIDDPERLSINL
jgi:integrase/recombinase XerD